MRCGSCPQEIQSRAKETNPHYKTTLLQVTVPIETHNERDMGALGELLMEIKNENIQVAKEWKKKENVGQESTPEGRQWGSERDIGVELRTNTSPVWNQASGGCGFPTLPNTIFIGLTPQCFERCLSLLTEMKEQACTLESERLKFESQLYYLPAV